MATAAATPSKGCVNIRDLLLKLRSLKKTTEWLQIRAEIHVATATFSATDSQAVLPSRICVNCSALSILYYLLEGRWTDNIFTKTSQQQQ